MRIVRNVSSLLSLAVLLPALCLAQERPVRRRRQAARTNCGPAEQLDQQRQALDAQQKALDASRSCWTAWWPRKARPPPFQPHPRGSAGKAGRTRRRRRGHHRGAHLAACLSHRRRRFRPGVLWICPPCGAPPNIGSGVATSFAGVPMGNTAAGRIQEFRSSAANSRVTLTITEHPTKNLTVTGYLEGDFYGTSRPTCS